VDCCPIPINPRSPAACSKVLVHHRRLTLKAVSQAGLPKAPWLIAIIDDVLAQCSNSNPETRVQQGRRGVFRSTPKRSQPQSSDHRIQAAPQFDLPTTSNVWYWPHTD